MKMNKLEEIVNGNKIPINRVVVASDGYAVPCKRAKDKHGIEPDIVFVRNDGWTLGAPDSLSQTAYNMWKADWVYFATKDEKKLRPIEEYRL